MEKFRKLKASEIDARVATVKRDGLSLLLYKDARVDMNILDETVGAERWQRKHDLINGNLFCMVGIRFESEVEDSYWVWKQDVGVESYTEKEKGQASDAFKRACFNWGIGRELYSAPFIWITADKCEIKPKGDGYTCYDRFEVTEIGYDDAGNIAQLVICNKGKEVYRLGGKPRTGDSVASQRIKTISKKDAEVLQGVLNTNGVNIEKLMAQYKVVRLEDLTTDQYAKIMRLLNESKG